MLNSIKKLFKKKPKEETTQPENYNIFKNKENKLMEGSSYLITIKQEVSDSGVLRTIAKPFWASRFRDERTNMTFLYSEDKKGNVNFMELFPERKEELAKLDPKKLQSQLIKDQGELKKIQQNPNSVQVNRNDVEFNIMKIKAQLSASKWMKCSFLSFGSSGEKEFTFLREGTSFFPIGFDPERNIFGIPSDIAKKSAWTWLRNKEIKHSKKSTFDKVVVTSVLVIAIMLGASAFMLYKAYAVYGDNPVNQAKADALDALNKCSEQNLKSAEQLNKIIENMDGVFQRPTTTIIKGIEPTSFN